MTADAVTNEEDREAIRELLEVDYTRRLNGADVEGYRALYADEVIWAIPNVPDARTPAEVAARMGALLERVEQKVTVELDDVDVLGDTAIVFGTAVGTAARRPDGEPKPLSLRVAWVLGREADGWRITRQIGTPKPTSA